MRKLLVLGVSLAMVACASPPQVVEKPVYVDRVVVINCIEEMPDKPYLVVPTLTESDGFEVVADAYMIDRRLLLGYAAVLESALVACGARPGEGLGSVPGKAIDNPGSGER